MITALLTASFQIIVRKGKDYGNALTGVLIGIIVNFPIMFAASYITWEPGWLNPTAISFFAATGIFGTGLGRFFLFLSIHRLGVALTSPLLSSIPLFSAALAFELLGERPDVYIWIATFVIFLGCLVITFKRGESPGWKPRYLWLPVITIISFSIGNILRKHSLNLLPAPLFGGTITYISAMSSLLLLSVFLPSEMRPNFKIKKGWIFWGFCGFINMLAFICRWIATKYGDLTVVIPLFASSSFFALFFSSFLLRDMEKVTVWSYLGTILIVLGVALIAITSF